MLRRPRCSCPPASTRGEATGASLCRSNVVYVWESGSKFPTAARAFEVAERVGLDPEAAVARFYGRRPDWLDDVRLSSPAGVAALLRDLRGRQPLARIAPAVHRNRYALGRWYSGATEPRLPDFFRLVEATSLRLLDLLAAFTDLDQLPAVAEAGRQLATARRIAHEAPWSHAVLRALELRHYLELPRHEPGWIARRVGISVEEEKRCLKSLETAGQIAWVDAKWRPRAATTLDLRHDARATQELAAWCDENGLSAQAAETRRRARPDDPNLIRVLALPLGVGESSALPKDAPAALADWHRRFWRLRRRQADAWFDLARRGLEALVGRGDHRVERDLPRVQRHGAKGAHGVD